MEASVTERVLTTPGNQALPELPEVTCQCAGRRRSLVEQPVLQTARIGAPLPRCPVHAVLHREAVAGANTGRDLEIDREVLRVNLQQSLIVDETVTPQHEPEFRSISSLGAPMGAWREASTGSGGCPK